MKLIDFGISGLLTQMAQEKINAGTLLYSAPEVISSKDKNFTPKIDIWS